jgi:hypothetical protein
MSLGVTACIVVAECQILVEKGFVNTKLITWFLQVNESYSM